MRVSVIELGRFTAGTGRQRLEKRLAAPHYPPHRKGNNEQNAWKALRLLGCAGRLFALFCGKSFWTVA